VFLLNALPAQARSGDFEQDNQAFIAFVRAHVGIGQDGTFVIDSQVTGRKLQMLQGIFEPLNANLLSVEKYMRPTLGNQSSISKGPGLNAPLQLFCGNIPRWAFEAFAWYVIAVGGYVSVVGLFLDATIFGLPAGAVLGAIGIGLTVTGSLLLWYVDGHMPEVQYVCF
jgi:hypothetical protein